MATSSPGDLGFRRGLCVITALHASHSKMTAALQEIQIISRNSLGKGHLAFSGDAGSVRAVSQGSLDADGPCQAKEPPSRDSSQMSHKYLRFTYGQQCHQAG